MSILGLSAQITDAGVTAPTFDEVLTRLQDEFRNIFGSDIYIEPDSQDGQQIALFAKAIHDANDAAIAIFNAFSPDYAQGSHLSSLVKLNNIKRLTPTYSTANGTVTGVAGTVITNGQVKDTAGLVWNLPASVTIPSGGAITVAVTAADPGAAFAPAGTINKIATPILGWQSFVSTTDAVTGSPVESDAGLRSRRALSTQLGALGPYDAMLGALKNLSGVQRVKIYENSTNAADLNLIPARTIHTVVEGGAAVSVAQIIGQKKAPGPGTDGTTTQNYTDPVSGIVYAIKYSPLTYTQIKVAVTIKAGAGYTSNTVPKIQAAIAAFINGGDIGQKVEYSRLWAPAYLNGDPDAKTYAITALTMAIGAAAQATADLTIAFNKAAQCIAASDVTVTVT